LVEGDRAVARRVCTGTIVSGCGLAARMQRYPSVCGCDSGEKIRETIAQNRGSRGSTQLGQGRSTLAVLLNPLRSPSVDPILHSSQQLVRDILSRTHFWRTTCGLCAHAWTRRVQHNISRAIAYIWIWTREFVMIEARAWDMWSFYRTGRLTHIYRIQ
jgi:hypothetical protein